MLLDNLARHGTDVLVADAGVIGTLRGREAIGGKAERATVLVHEVFLLEAEPSVWIIRDRRTRVRRAGHAGVLEGLAHHEHSVLAGRIRKNRHGLEHDVRALALGLLGRAAVEAPPGQFGESRQAGEFLDLSFAAQTGQGRVAIEPDVFQFVFSHNISGWDKDKVPRDRRQRAAGARVNSGANSAPHVPEAKRFSKHDSAFTEIPGKSGPGEENRGLATGRTPANRGGQAACRALLLSFPIIMKICPASDASIPTRLLMAALRAAKPRKTRIIPARNAGLAACGVEPIVIEPGFWIESARLIASPTGC